MDEQTLNDILECSVCLECLDTSSKALPCQHTFCRKCLEVIYASRQELRCPECRILVDTKIDDLPPNVLLMRILEGKKIHKPHIEEKRPVEFPSSFFRANQHQKPILNIPICDDLAKLRKQIVSAVEGKPVPVDFAISYLYMVLKERKVTTLARISSYDVVLAEPNTNIDPFFMVNVNLTTAPSVDTPTSNTAVSEADDKWLTIWILGLYRLERASDPSYRKTLIKTITDQVKIAGWTNACGFQNALVTLPSWTSSPEYRKIVACTDWFFFINNSHPWSNVRVSTIGSRYRDCAALTSLLHTTRVLGLPDIPSFIDWTSNETITNELTTMLMQDEEDGVINSYFPYQVDMGLVTRCAFSSRLNPAAYTYCHIIGAMHGNTRSLNVRYFLEEDVHGVIFNAQWVACVFLPISRNERQFVPMTGTVEQMRNEFMRQREPKEPDPDAWFNFMESNGWTLTKRMRRKIIATANEIRSPREGTIAELLTRAIFRGDT